METFGNRLERVRKLRKLSVRELADLSGVPAETIYRVEKGTHHEPRVSVAAKLAVALGISIDVLAGIYDRKGLEGQRRPSTEDQCEAGASVEVLCSSCGSTVAAIVA